MKPADYYKCLECGVEQNRFLMTPVPGHYRRICSTCVVVINRRYGVCAPRPLEDSSEVKKPAKEKRAKVSLRAELLGDATMERAKEAAAQLPQRQRAIIERRWLADVPEAVGDLALSFGVSASMVYILQNKALESMRKLLHTA